MAPLPPVVGWPFLIASGRRRDYTILLAPDFLVADLDHGILEHAVRPSADEEPAVVEVRTGHGHRLTVVSVTHLLTAADLGAGKSAAGTTAGPRDEHGRPLRLIYGFASRHTGIGEPAQADLRIARERALDVYRRFLANEERAGIVPSRAFPLRTHVTRPAPMPPAPAAVPPAASDVAPRTPVAIVGVAAIIAGAVLAAVFLVPWSRPPVQTPTPCPSITTTAPVTPPSCGPTVHR